MKTELWLFTMNFPFGNGEAYLESELSILTKGPKRVRLFPLFSEGAVRPLPPGVEVECLFTREEAYRSISLWRLPFRLRRFTALWRQVRRSAPNAAVFRNHRRILLSQVRQLLEHERLMQLRVADRYDPARVSLYSYWTSDWATVLGLWKMRDERVRFTSRMHGFDLYAERSADAWPRFQAFQVAQADRILVASQDGLNDLTKRYPQARNTFRLGRLGTRDHGLGPWVPAAELRLLSCSNLIPLKRVHLIAEALALLEGPVHWTHFGDGPERERVEAGVSTLPSNIHVELMGSRPNSEVIAWYNANPVDVFVHASYTEGGAPVALQEAASFGIPLIAADAGGVREIVTPESGILLPNALTAELLAETLGRFKDSGWHDAAARARVRALWASQFNAEDVYARSREELLDR